MEIIGKRFAMVCGKVLILCLLLEICGVRPVLGRAGVGAKTKAALNPEELEPQYWRDLARKELDEAMNKVPIQKRAKNVILFLGDGMSIATITATRILKGQKQGKTGEETVLAYERFPNIGLSKTYNVDHMIPDSAGTATAYLTGVKANYATIGVNAKVGRGECAKSIENNEKSILEYMQDAGKATGFITTARVTHASPAPLYAFSADRKWENDDALSQEAKDQGCKDIGAQLVEDIGKKIKVVMGGGRGELLPTNETDPEHNKGGKRKDGRNIIKEWVQHKRSLSETVQYAWNGDQLNSINAADTENLIGLFEYSHMRYSLEQEEGNDPSLSDMVAKALAILSKDQDGYFLFVEGAQIDIAHHDNFAVHALHDSLAFEDAIARALEITDQEDTLIMVTADHAVPIVLHSYATRGIPILGLTDYTDDDQKGGPSGLSDVDFKPYPILAYGDGPGFNASRPNLTNVDTSDPNFKIPTAVPTKWVSHDGQDVAIYARGPMSHLIHTTHEQNYIFHAMKYAACLADDSDRAHCTGGGVQTGSGHRPSAMFIAVGVSIWVTRCLLGR